MEDLAFSVDELIMYLQSQCPWPFSKELVQRLREIIQCRIVAKNEFLLEIGSVSKHIYFIARGVLRCYYESEKGQITSWVLKEGDVVVSVQSFYDQKKSVENIQAIEETLVFYISYDELEALYLQFPEFNYIGRVLTIKYLKFWNIQLYNLRKRSKMERFQLLLNGDDAELFNRVPHKYLASYLDMTPDTFSRLNNSPIE